MPEVMRWKLKGFIPGIEGVSKALFQPWVVQAEDFDRVTAERDAALAENKLLRHDVASYLETVAKVCDMLGVDLESAKSAEGKPSDVLFGYVSSMQQLLTAADERADELEGLLRDINDAPGGSQFKKHIDAALKPAEAGADSCEFCKGWGFRANPDGADEGCGACNGTGKEPEEGGVDDPKRI